MARRRAKSQIHINRHLMVNDLKTGEKSPVITVQRSGRKMGNAHQVDIVSPTGEVLASVVYQPDKPLHCGARAWIETTHDVVLREAA